MKKLLLIVLLSLTGYSQTNYEEYFRDLGNKFSTDTLKNKDTFIDVENYKSKSDYKNWGDNQENIIVIYNNYNPYYYWRYSYRPWYYYYSYNPYYSPYYGYFNYYGYYGVYYNPYNHYNYNVYRGGYPRTYDTPRSNPRTYDTPRSNPRTYDTPRSTTRRR